MNRLMNGDALVVESESPIVWDEQQQGWATPGCIYADTARQFSVEFVPATRDELKAARQLAVDAIKVTTQLGHTFDGDEVAQSRMARAIIAMQATGTASTLWVLADNTVIPATVAELAEALALSGAAQSALWVLPPANDAGR